MDFFEALDSSLEDVTIGYMRGVAAPLRSIDPALIDQDRSESAYHPGKGVVIIRTYSVDDVCCPLYIALGTHCGLFFVAYGESYGSDLNARDENEAKDFEDVLRGFLSKEVTEERTMVGERLARVRYCYPISVRGRTRVMCDSESKLRIWPWSDKHVTLTNYRAWLPRKSGQPSASVL